MDDPAIVTTYDRVYIEVRNGCRGWTAMMARHHLVVICRVPLVYEASWAAFDALADHLRCVAPPQFERF